MPTGLGVYLKASPKGFEPELMGSGTFPRFSKESLEYLDMIQGKGLFYTFFLINLE